MAPIGAIAFLFHIIAKNKLDLLFEPAFMEPLKEYNPHTDSLSIIILFDFVELKVRILIKRN